MSALCAWQRPWTDLALRAARAPGRHLCGSAVHHDRAARPPSAGHLHDVPGSRSGLGHRGISSRPTACASAYERFQPEALLVGASCTAELIQDDPGGLAEDAGTCPFRSSRSSCPPISARRTGAHRRPSTRSFGTSPDRRTSKSADHGSAKLQHSWADCAGLPPSRRCDARSRRLLGLPSACDVNVVAPMGASPADIARTRRRGFQRCDLSRACRDRRSLAGGRVTVSPTRRPRSFRSVSGDPRLPPRKPPNLAGVRSGACAGSTMPICAMPWWSASGRFSTYLTGKRVFVFGDATHAIAAAKVAAYEFEFASVVVGMGCYNREAAREVRAVAAEKWAMSSRLSRMTIWRWKRLLIAETSARTGSLAPKWSATSRSGLGLPCAVISAPMHVQDFPARFAPQ